MHATQQPIEGVGLCDRNESPAEFAGEPVWAAEALGPGRPKAQREAYLRSETFVTAKFH